LTDFAQHDDAKDISYVPKKNRLVLLLSSMHMIGEINATVTDKPEIIKYYNKTKRGSMLW